MKKIFTLIAIFSAYATCVWAQTPNPSFENWTHVNGFPSGYDNPDGWDTPNSQTAYTSTFSVVKGITAHSGSLSIQLITKVIPIVNILIPGAASTGTFPTSLTGTITGGIPYTLKPDSIAGWYKYAPQGGENGFVGFDLFGDAANTDTVAEASFATPTTAVSTFTRFAVPLVYRSANTVVNSLWVLASSNENGTSAGVNSTLNVDDLAIIINPIVDGVAKHNSPEIKVYPNPAADHLEVRYYSNIKAKFALYNVAGRKVAEHKNLDSGKTTIVDLSSLPDGIYMYSVTDENNAVLKTDRLIIQK